MKLQLLALALFATVTAAPSLAQGTFSPYKAAAPKPAPTPGYTPPAAKSYGVPQAKIYTPPEPKKPEPFKPYEPYKPKSIFGPDAKPKG